MKKLLAALAATTMLSTAAHAAGCTVVSGSPANLQFLSCTSDSQANDGDDLKMFVDGVTNATSANGSLGKNNNSPLDANVTITGLGGGTFSTSTDGNGFANFKSVSDLVTAYEATPNTGTILPTDGSTFLGFDGELFRGQLVNLTNSNTPWDGNVTIVVNLSDGTQATHTFTGFKLNNDIGVLGFDEINDPGVFVTSAFAIAGNGLSDPGLGSWDEFKQIEFSVPGQTAAIPELKTWAMMLTGFAGLMLVGSRRRKARTELV